jgi:serine/threonine protein kinase
VSPDIKKLLDLAAQIPSERRAQFLARQCPNPQVRAEVSALIRYADDAESCFEEAIQGVAASLRCRHEPCPGDAIGSYRIVSLIDRGGMGSVYLAERSDGEIQQRVAVKLLRADGHRPGWRERFLKERQLLASLHHPSIVHVIDAGQTEDGQPFLVMEHVEGVPIDSYAAGIDVRERLKLFVRVCEGVSHAHRRLIIHRDLKPSNILVDSTGQPKLLDFGIAKPLDDARDVTQAAEQLLTPDYASPEQLKGEAQSTATDVYSLGAVLYKLLTGVTPRDNARGMAAAPPSHVNPEVPKDLDFVIRTALRQEPEDRYGSVDEFANDVRAVLEWRPVQARAGDVWYRARRHLRRYWAPAVAALLVMSSLAGGLWVANRERDISERRFRDVRQLANRLFDIEYEVRKLAGNTKTREFIVTTSLEYLRRLAAETDGDPALALEVATAYLQVARVQGVPTAPNLGRIDQAEQSLRMADGFVRSVLASRPANGTALLRSAQILHDRMLLARYSGRYDEALALARKSAQWLEKIHAGSINKSDHSPLLHTYVNVADQHVRGRQFDEALRICRRAMGLARSLGRKDYLGDLLWSTAEVYRCRGDLDQALEEIDESVRVVQPPAGSTELWRTRNFILTLTNKGLILGEEDTVSLGRSKEALECLDQAFRLADGLVHQDPNDESARGDVGETGTTIGDILRFSDPVRALAIYDHTLRHLAELKQNSRMRRFEIRGLAGSSYVLRQLGRTAEARQRLDAAFERLHELNLYPAAEIKLGSEAEYALRALAEYEAGGGRLARSVSLYQKLLDQSLATKPSPETDLTNAVRMSTIYRSASAVQRRAGLDERATALEARDRDLWQHWDRMLPNNSFVRRYLATVVIH